jgi:hypothetical protein
MNMILNRQDAKNEKFLILEKQSFLATLAPWRLISFSYGF